MRLSETRWQDISHRAIFTLGNNVYIVLRCTGRATRRYSTVYVYSYQNDAECLIDVPIASSKVFDISLSAKHLLPRTIDIVAYGYASELIPFDRKMISAAMLRRIAEKYDTEFRRGNVETLKIIGRTKYDR